jgi:hypothetical protein
MSENEIEELKKRITELEYRITKLENHKIQNKKMNPKKLSIKEFIRSKSPQNDVQKTLIIGYYLEKYENFDNFNVNDLKKYFKDAREKVPLNVADKIQLNIKKGHIMDFGDKKDDLKSYVLTSSGEDYVDNDLRDW